MDLYWEDITTPNMKWRALEITVNTKQNIKPMLHLEICSKRFFKLMYGTQTLFWARQHYKYYGVALIKANILIENTPIVSSINSIDVEERKQLVGSEKLKSWAKYFIQSLSKNKNQFFYSGKWLIRPFTYSSWQYTDTQELKQSHIDERIFDALDSSIYQYVSWFHTPSKDVAFVGLHSINEDNSRLKWWRKKAKENTLPPILLYYISALDTYVLIDGHYRLKAAQLENILPETLVISTYHLDKYIADPKIKTSILKSLQNRKKNRQLTLDETNDILINAYTEEHIYVRQTSKAWQSTKEKCLLDLISYLDPINKVSLAQLFFNETDGEGWS